MPLKTFQVLIRTDVSLKCTAGLRGAGRQHCGIITHHLADGDMFFGLLINGWIARFSYKRLLWRVQSHIARLCNRSSAAVDIEFQVDIGQQVAHG